MEIYGVIMAGGNGTRFWPLSRKQSPKQILNISGNDAMINETIARMEGMISLNNTIVVCSSDQETVIKNVLTQTIKDVLIEPIPRNTAAAIGLAAIFIKKKDSDAVMCVFPSDHFVKDVAVFQQTIKKGIAIAKNTDKLVTIGIKPKFPSTGYGYIKYSDEFEQIGAFTVNKFVEKPDFERAKQYIEQGKYLWNSGMFIWKASSILKNIERFLPRLYNGLIELSNYIDTPNEKKMLDEIYPKLESISIDYGIMERSIDAVVIPSDFGWNDVGSLDAFDYIYEKDELGNVIIGNHIALSTKDCIVYGENHLIATIGLDNVVVIHTKDATLVSLKDNVQDVKKVVDILNKMGRSGLV